MDLRTFAILSLLWILGAIRLERSGGKKIYTQNGTFNIPPISVIITNMVLVTVAIGGAYLLGMSQ